MFGLFSKKKKMPDASLFKGFTDWHCHILPGVDDGFRSVEDSLAILAAYEEAGVSTIWFTPHIMEECPNTTDGLRAVFARFCDAYEKDNAERNAAERKLSLNLAAENMIDPLFDRRLAARDLLPLSENRLLVETSFFAPPMNLEQTLDEIKSAGFFPVLAHPERYMYMDEAYYKRLKDKDIQFQMNVPARLGLYGKEIQKKALLLEKKGFYSLKGTDLHNLRMWSKINEYL